MNAETVPVVNAEEGHELVEAGALLLDVREADEWEAGHAPEATWIPMGELTARVGELPADRAHRRHLPLREPVARRRRRVGAGGVRRGEPRRRHARVGRRGLRRRGRRRPPGRRHLARAPRTRSSANLYPSAATMAGMARRKLSVQGKVAAAGVSVAVAGVLAGFMAAGDHHADATPTSSGTSSSGTSSSSSALDPSSTPSGSDRGATPSLGSGTSGSQYQPQPQTRTGGS